jgi:hypothetical protein
MVDPGLISDRRFAQSYTAFWQDVMPMSDSFIRSLNLRKGKFAKPLKGTTPPDRRGLVNELGFRLYARWHESGGRHLDEDEIRSIAERARLYVGKLRPLNAADSAPVSDDEISEAFKLAEGIAAFQISHGDASNVTVDPVFRGCGRIQECRGDLLFGDILLEVKAGDRDFRVVDLRQLIVYCVLNYAAENYVINHIGVVNPRNGVFFMESIELVAHATAGKLPVELFSEVLSFISLEAHSR